ncbi:MAG: ATP-binding protein, partial [Vicinamibacterales bacterium]
ARAILRGAVSTIAVRSGHPREARAAAAEICAALHRRPLLLEGAPPPGLGPWLFLASAVPVICTELAPGERRAIAEIPGWAGPVLIATGLDGSFERDGDAVPGWRVPMPDADERTQLWHATLGDADLATRLGHDHRHATVRIAELARAARYQAEVAGAGRVGAQWIAAAARNGTGGDLGVLAELLSESIPDDALILPEAVRTELESFADRCRSRDALADRLGPAARARYRPGVRALFVGPSGTGKTLAAGWLATGLGLPLYRVDLASVTSKFIGETEKNLAQLFARAEHAEVVLLFDEADSLFGKRTDVRDSNDRFANAQTNYLLTRIESFEGIAILTSNSRSRFDSAFTRRLDAIIEFTSPGPDERRALWVAHLGENHELPVSSLNRIAALCDLTGGHVRNVVLNAAARARRHDRGISERDLTEALLAEYTKLGRTPPVLRHASPPPPEA